MKCPLSKWHYIPHTRAHTRVCVCVRARLRTHNFRSKLIKSQVLL